jgi:hypothetical protein
MVTLFTVPKAFSGRIATIQMNAIGSWAQLSPPCETIVIGDDEGAAEAAHALGVRHVAQVQRNEYGTPLVSSIFDIAHRVGQGELLCYLNADMVLMSDFLEAVRQVSKWRKRFLMVGQRWDLDVAERLDFDQPGWEQELRSHALQRGRLHPPTGIDYFVFTRGVFESIPPFAVGRIPWDNWLVNTARYRRIPIIDATSQVMAIHQDHEYGHLRGGRDEVLRGVEAQRNLELAGEFYPAFYFEQCTHRLTPAGVKLDLGLDNLPSRIRVILQLHPRFRLLKPVLRFIYRLSRPLRSCIAKALPGKRRDVGP